MRKMDRHRRILLTDLNALITCPLCHGYYIDATSFDCLHTFCRSCLLKHFESTRQQACPTCDKKKPFYRADHQLQALVYKMVPGLHAKETQRRDDFFRSAVRATSSCSEDSVLDAPPKCTTTTINNSSSSSSSGSRYLSADDAISLSLEFYQTHLDTTDASDIRQRRLATCTTPPKTTPSKSTTNLSERRYLQCPAAVSMSHLQKFVRMKYALTPEHRVDIIYAGEVLPLHSTLIDVAYTFNWTKAKPLRFFYRIFTPLKVQPIRIVAASQRNGSKQLQIVPVRPSDGATSSKEQFAAQLRLQAAGKQRHLAEPHCVFEYEEPDKDEIEKFAESRDREWARMAADDSASIGASPELLLHVRKRKKSKHSRADKDAKKAKLLHHAVEITDATVRSNIKLKVKLTTAPAAPSSGAIVAAVQSPTPSPPKKKTESVRKLSEIVIRKDAAPSVVVSGTPSTPSLSQTTFPKPLAADAAQCRAQMAAPAARKTPHTYPNAMHALAKSSLERKIAALQVKKQNMATVAPPSPPKKVTFASDKPHILNNGFTVSRITSDTNSTNSSALKRRGSETDVRPALEITPIPYAPPPSTTAPSVVSSKAKRPLPATIPLERIMKKGALKLDATALDLSPKAKKLMTNGGGTGGGSGGSSAPITTLNGLTNINGIKYTNAAPPPPPPPPTPSGDKNSLSNLQMLSKVALQHSKQANGNNGNAGKVTRPQMPSLQTIAPPARTLPKLNEIGKGAFKMVAAHARNSNVAARSIPNPSLLVRQHQQNRLSLNGACASVKNVTAGNSSATIAEQPKILNLLAKENTGAAGAGAGGGVSHPSGGKCKDDRPPPKMMPICSL